MHKRMTNICKLLDMNDDKPFSNLPWGDCCDCLCGNFFFKVSESGIGKNLEKLAFQCKMDFLKFHHFCQIEKNLELKHWMSGFGFCKNNYLSVDGWVPKEKF